MENCQVEQKKKKNGWFLWKLHKNHFEINHCKLKKRALTGQISIFLIIIEENIIFNLCITHKKGHNVNFLWILIKRVWMNSQCHCERSESKWHSLSFWNETQWSDRISPNEILSLRSRMTKEKPTRVGRFLFYWPFACA